MSKQEKSFNKLYDKMYKELVKLFVDQGYSQALANYKAMFEISQIVSETFS
jgi:hypothetical protein